MLSSTVNSHQGRVNWIYSQKQMASVSEIFGDTNLIIYSGKIRFGIIIFYKPFLHGLKTINIKMTTI